VHCIELSRPDTSVDAGIQVGTATPSGSSVGARSFRPKKSNEKTCPGAVQINASNAGASSTGGGAVAASFAAIFVPLYGSTA
jgi:hypothetical protein